MDATGIVVLHFPKHHPIAVKHDMVDATIEEVVTCQFDIETMLEEVFRITGSVLLIIFKSLISLCFITCLIRISLNLKNDQKNRPHDPSLHDSTNVIKR